MPFLLDTHTLLWAIQDSSQLSRVARTHISDTKNVCFFSIVSLWEITIKFSLKALDLEMSLSDCFDIIKKTGFTELPVRSDHLLRLASLPYHHKDPFDRLLIAQAISEDLTFITKDNIIPLYDVRILW